MRWTLAAGMGVTPLLGVTTSWLGPPWQNQQGLDLLYGDAAGQGFY